ncbi:ABC-type dipeptide transport system, periplasmic component [Roseibacterium elongatum DSM 19469]|uniref:ABC-type dipeptide transport system, periplasmic component n=1 Tax=Roseicyclus elongatus DSM 19469 TaxID=1294273 RepID=W8S1V4_9RHOB|nr:hypothetical protein [Roseibacterium elongatum]AHM04162.1 ABC-type dipeptide transport system, periplasmic component [Roseibacterium elongatum DSM 19469]
MPSRLLRRFWNDTGAAVAFETVLVLPMLIWAFIGSFVFFDAFRVYNTSIKATYMIADMISRQTSTVYAYDIAGMTNIMGYVVRDVPPVEMRVTQIGMVSGTYRVDWSYGVNGAARLFNASLSQVEHLLPEMGNGERIVLVETTVAYDPPFDLGLTAIDFENQTLVRPRYAGQVPFDDDDTPPNS